jgi:transcriptional regulator with XRE-family HTH domain
LRWLIGNELRHARSRAGLTQADAAKALGCSQPKITHLESGRNQQQPEEVATLLRHFGCDAAHVDRMASLAGRADHGTWWAPFTDVVPDWLKTFMGLEGLAKREFSYEPLLLHGLIQIPEYTAALLTNHLRVRLVDIERIVKLRRERQLRLSDADNPLHFTAVIEESALDRMVGGPTVMRGQLRHLLDLSERGNITLHLMPLAVAVHDGLDGEFALLDFDDALSIGYVEFPDGAVYVQDQDQVSAYTMAAKRMCAAALSPADTVKAIKSRLSRLT